MPSIDFCNKVCYNYIWDYRWHIQEVIYADSLGDYRRNRNCHCRSHCASHYHHWRCGIPVGSGQRWQLPWHLTLAALQLAPLHHFVIKNGGSVYPLGRSAGAILWNKMAEATGFEPANGANRYTLSKRAPSTTRPHFRFTYYIIFLSFKILRAML